jgi:hypothetical protein
MNTITESESVFQINTPCFKMTLLKILIVVSVGDVPEDTKRDMAMRLKKDGATRATSVGDLHERLHKKLEELRGIYRTKHTLTSI